jgi:SAM-dependent methyltransferase
MMSAPSACYPGVDNLEALKEAENYNRYLASLIDEQLSPGCAVVDFGAGIGTFALPLLARGVRVVCVEPDPLLAAHLRSAGAATVPSLDEIAQDSIDLIYSFNVLEHIADDGAAIRAMAAKLKRGARLLAYVPAFEVLFSAMDRRVGHLRRYRRRGLTRLLSGSGLRVVDARYADSLGFVVSLLYRMIGNRAGTINPVALKLYDRWLFPLSRVADIALSRWIGKNVLAIAIKE